MFAKKEKLLVGDIKKVAGDILSKRELYAVSQATGKLKSYNAESQKNEIQKILNTRPWAGSVFQEPTRFTRIHLK